MSDDGLPQIATFGAGCFWCFDAVARRTPGVLSSVVGYAGGPGPAPTYRDVHMGRGGSSYVEAVQLQYDSKTVGFSSIVDLFFRTHDATTPNQDGANFGPEYHSTIFYHSEEQHQEAGELIRVHQDRLGRPIITSLRPYTTFFPAEVEHQDFYSENPRHPYCRYVIVPKLQKALGQQS